MSCLKKQKRRFRDIEYVRDIAQRFANKAQHAQKIIRNGDYFDFCPINDQPDSEAVEIIQIN